jgi:hypothetical protein
MGLTRQACHKRNKRKQSERDEPLADRVSARRSECVGAHFACECFKQWGGGCFSDPKKWATTERKSSFKAENLKKTRISWEYILFFMVGVG